MKKKRVISCLTLVLTVLLIASCAKQDPSTNHSGDAVGESYTTEELTEQQTDNASESVSTMDGTTVCTTAEEWMDSHTLEEKVAQLFIVNPEALTGGDTVTAVDETFLAAYEQYPVGGFIFFADNMNTSSTTMVLLNSIKTLSEEKAGVTAFLSVDEEGGTVARVANNAVLQVENVGNMSDIGATGDSQNAAAAGATIGSYLSMFGFNMDFAPVADVWSNPNNTVVQYRSFGNDPSLVSDMVLAEKDALEENGIISVIKHFPGHGATEGDTHDGYAYTNATYEDLQACDLIPFQAAIEDGVNAIMVSHIAAPNVTGDDTPASLSSKMMTEILRGDMGYNGIVITDAMNMEAITEQYSSSEAAVQALLAGADIILMPQDFTEAYEGVLQAVLDGTLSEERIDESVERILKVKYDML